MGKGFRASRFDHEPVMGIGFRAPRFNQEPVMGSSSRRAWGLRAQVLSVLPRLVPRISGFSI